MKMLLRLFLGLVLVLCVATAFAARGVTVKEKQGAKSVSFKTNYYALVIGNNDYRSLPHLQTAVSDAKEVSRVLSEKYGFKTTLLVNATRKDILTTINDFRKKLNETDSFLIYYAGHGEYDKTADKGYWLPVDAVKDDPVDWIMAEDITSNIRRILAKHVLIVSDSCYSGSLSRSTTSDLGKKGARGAFLAKMMERSSRTLMASGGNEPVADAGGRGNHSVFASAFLTALKDSDQKTFTAEELFHGRVKEIVAGKSDQVPEYNNIRNSGHEGGDFIFQLAQGGGDEETAADAETPVSVAPPGTFTLLGWFAYSGAGGADMAVDPASQRVYLSGGMGQHGLIRIDASNPGSMTQTTLSYGGGIAVDKTTGRYATTNAYGGTLFIFNPNDTLYDSAALSGCGGALDADAETGRFFISTQCNDHIAVYSETSKSLLANISAGGVGSIVVFDPGTGNVFENVGGVNAPLVVSSSGYGTSTPFTGFVHAADGTLKRLYVGNNGNLSVLDSTTFATLHTFAGLSYSFVVVDEALGRFYTVWNKTLTVYDAVSYAQLATFTLPAVPQNLRMAPGDNRLYEIDGSRLYVLQR